MTSSRGPTQSPCPVCTSSGHPLYSDVSDRVHHVPGVWNTAACTNAACDAQWITPRPAADAILGFYAAYETHESTDSGRHSRMPSWYPSPLSRRQRADRLRTVLPPTVAVAPPGQLFEIGCGNGVNLLRLRSLGWTVRGQDFDPLAVDTARSAGLNVSESLDAVLATQAGSFDVVLLSHVVEHVHDLDRVFADASSLLAVGGTLVVITPNGQSLSAKAFRSAWRGLEAPRHLQVFGPRSLRAALTAQGFNHVEVTTSYLADGYLAGRSVAPRNNRASLVVRGLATVSTQLVADTALRWWPSRGGELIATAIRP